MKTKKNHHDIYLDINAYLIRRGPTEGMKLASEISNSIGWRVDEVFRAIDKAIEIGSIYFDDSGTVFLLPEHEKQLIDYGAY